MREWQRDRHTETEIGARSYLRFVRPQQLSLRGFTPKLGHPQLVLFVRCADRRRSPTPKRTPNAAIIIIFYLRHYHQAEFLFHGLCNCKRTKSHNCSFADFLNLPGSLTPTRCCIGTRYYIAGWLVAFSMNSEGGWRAVVVDCIKNTESDMHTLCVSAFSSSSSSSSLCPMRCDTMRGGRLKGCAVMMTSRCTGGKEMVRSIFPQ